MSAEQKNSPHSKEERNSLEGSQPHEDTEPHKGDEENHEDAELKKYDKQGPHPILGLIIFTACQFVALLFVVTATPIEFFVINEEWTKKIWDIDGKMCVTAWGMKNHCRKPSYYMRDYVSSFCYPMRINFKIIEAFCIMTIAFMTLGLGMGVLSIFQKVGKGSAGAIGTFAAMMCLIPWGITAGMYFQEPCCETDWANLGNPIRTCYFGPKTLLAGTDTVVPQFRKMGRYGAAFPLLVTAWCLQVIGCVFAFAPL